MKKTALLVSMLLICLSVSALDIDNNELNKAGKVKFINYVGSDSGKVSQRDMNTIGKALSRESKSGTRIRFYMKYSVLRADAPEENSLLSADIFSIDPDARVNHVNVVRGILSSYISKRFGYTKRESDAIAVLTTFYNAVYRGDLEYLGGIYKKVVMNEVRRYNAGMSTRYFEWPGKTKILIPLTEGNSNSIDVITANDEKVTKELRSRKDKSINERKEIIKIEEKQIDKTKENIKKKEEELNRKKEEAKKKKEDIDREKTRIQKEKTDLDKKKRESDKINDKKRKDKTKEEITEKEKEIKKKDEEVKEKEDKQKKEETDNTREEKNVEKKKDEVKKQEEKVEKEKEQVKKDEDSVKDQKNDDSKNSKKKDKSENEQIVEEKKKIEKEKEKLDKEKKELEIKKDEVTAKLDKVYKDKFYYLKVNNWFNDGIYNNEMYIINPGTRKIIMKSPYRTIAGRKYDIFPKGVVVIGYLGKARDNFEHKLVILSHDKLEPVLSGADIIFWRSFVEVRDSEIYCVLMLDGKFYLARYNDKLERIAKSDAEIDKDSVITFYESNIYINSPERKILVLKKEDLTYIQTIDPDIDKD